jgi:hypothetical protein
MRLPAVDRLEIVLGTGGPNGLPAFLAGPLYACPRENLMSDVRH